MYNRGRLSGLALRIYIYLLESGKPKTVREIADALGVPHSSVHYHLKKLVELNIVGRTPQGYIVTDKIDIEGYIILRNRVIPRLMVYSLFFLGLFLGELLLLCIDPRLFIDRILLLITTFTAFIILFLESLHMRIS